MRGILYDEYKTAVRVGLGTCCIIGQMVETNEVAMI